MSVFMLSSVRHQTKENASGPSRMQIDIDNLVQTNVIVCALLILIKRDGFQLVNADVAI